jgi:phenylpropionate dioxygenase-like ring-hydroxylating dioxygenase large terminal subunit
MLNDSVLLNDWHVVAYAPALQEGKPIGVRLLDEDIVLWRVGEKIYAWRDLCVHRGTRLSLGKVENQTLICPYHGWVYNAELHLRSDRTAIAYRKWLKELGLTFGTA